MRNLFLFLLIFITLTSCFQNADREKTKKLAEVEKTKKSIVCNFILTDIDKEDFTIIEKGDTTYYVPETYENIYGKPILFDKKNIKTVNTKMKIWFGFLQYTNDDNEAFPLEYTQNSEWQTLEVKNGKIIIPDFYGNSKNQRVFEILNFSDNNQLEKWVASGNFSKLKAESIQAQKEFFKSLLLNKKNYTSCCPEYIKQAETFLNKNETMFNSTKDLGIELFIKKMEINISGELSNGEPFRKVIISE